MSRQTHFTGTMWLTFQPLFLNALSIPAMAYIIHGLGALHYGEWAVANSLVGIAALTTNLGLRTLFVRHVAQHPGQTEQVMAEQLGLRTTLVCLSALVVMFACKNLGYSQTILICVAISSLSLVLSVLASILGDALQGLEQFRSYSMAGLVAGLTLTGASIIAVWMKTGPIGLSLAYVTGPFINLVLLGRAVRRQYSIRVCWNIARFQDLLKQSRLITGQNIAGQIQERLEQLLIPKYIGVANFGVFSAGTLPISRLAVIPDGLLAAFFPAVSRAYQEADGKAAKHLTDLSIMAMIVCMPIAILVTFAAGPISHLLLPNNSSACTVMMQTTVWSLPLMGIWYAMGCGLLAANKHAETSRIGIWSHGISMAVSFILISRYGLIGACWAWIGRYALPPIMLAPLFLRTFPAVLPKFPLWRLLASSACMALALWGQYYFLRTHGLGVACLEGSMAVFVYAVVLVLLRLVSHQQIAQKFIAS